MDVFFGCQLLLFIASSLRRTLQQKILFRLFFKTKREIVEAVDISTAFTDAFLAMKTIDTFKEAKQLKALQR